MTACNLFVADDAAHLIADRAWFQSDGTIIGYSPKVGVSPRLRMAVAVAGLARGTVAETITDWLDAQSSQERAMRALADLARGIVEHRANMTATDRKRLDKDGQGSVVVLSIATWSQERDQPEGYVLFTGTGPDLPTVPLWRPYGTRRYIMPVIPAELAPGVDLDPVVDGLALVRTQKRLGGRVGGLIDLATVDRDGARVRTIGNCDEDRGPLRSALDIVVRPLLGRRRGRAV